MPPRLWLCSKAVTEWPSLRSSRMATRPAAPAPTTACAAPDELTQRQAANGTGPRPASLGPLLLQSHHRQCPRHAAPSRVAPLSRWRGPAPARRRTRGLCKAAAWARGPRSCTAPGPRPAPAHSPPHTAPLGQARRGGARAPVLGVDGGEGGRARRDGVRPPCAGTQSHVLLAMCRPPGLGHYLQPAVGGSGTRPHVLLSTCRPPGLGHLLAAVPGARGRTRGALGARPWPRGPPSGLVWQLAPSLASPASATSGWEGVSYSLPLPLATGCSLPERYAWRCVKVSPPPLSCRAELRGSVTEGTLSLS